ncbi:MAG: hypothetical protein A4E72_00566 [Syntrophus sp. PtaU1.Bin208]|nr:MAG: hypothetical protein A4E72_00566 [Syntrophus sp. PtaU1.Bin208]
MIYNFRRFVEEALFFIFYNDKEIFAIFSCGNILTKQWKRFTPFTFLQSWLIKHGHLYWWQHAFKFLLNISLYERSTMQNYLNDVRPYHSRRAWPRQGKCALLVIDMQNYFLPVASPIVDRVLFLLVACRSKKIRVIFSCHGHRDIEKYGLCTCDGYGKFVPVSCGQFYIMDILDWEG